MRRNPPSTIHIYPDLPSTQIIQTHNSHRHNTTPPLQTLVQAPLLLPTYTTATKTQTHVQHFPTGLVKPKPNSLIHSPPPPPSQPTPPLAKHIHISHTPPTHLIPRTTLIHNTSAALDTIPYSPQPHLIHLPHQHCFNRAPSHSFSIHTCNTNSITRITFTAST